MKYQEFISAVAKNKTDRVIPLSIPESSAPDLIPVAFKALIPDVIQIIDKHFDELSDGMPYLGVFGLQPVGVRRKVSSSTLSYANPLTDIAHHLCCVIYFLPLKKPYKSTNWSNYKSLVIDFTSGSIIDNERYLHFAIHSDGLGKTYGKVQAKKLNDAWRLSVAGI